MFVQVRLLNGFEQQLTYSVPENLQPFAKEGSLIKVPLKKQILTGIVTATSKENPLEKSIPIRSIIGCEQFPCDPAWHKFISIAAPHYFLEPLFFFQRLKTVIASSKKGNGAIPAQKPERPYEKPTENQGRSLTLHQQEVVDYVAPFITQQSYAPTLIHGVTGCGKTEIYKELIIKSILENKSVIFMTPEVSLALRFKNLLRAELPLNVEIKDFHSATSSTEKKELWSALCANQPLLIIGVHLPVHLPIPNLGLIIVDEEHESGYKEKKFPRLHSKELAILRAYTQKIPIVLGSATPSINTLYLAKNHDWRVFRLTERFAGSFPSLSIVPLRTKDNRKSFWITHTLLKALQECLAKKQQALIFINRRGYSFFMLCKECGYTFNCPHCSVTLTLHEKEGVSVSRYLQCHYCNYTQAAPNLCISCQAAEKQLIQKGIGTQQTVSILQKLLPQARICRADLDSTKKKRAWEKTLADFTTGNIDILVGTQTITKGYHFPNVTLVGVIWGDLNFHLPIYTARENALQQLVQVAGRAGRVENESKVIVQVMCDDPFFSYIDERVYPEFYALEENIRSVAMYPPFCRLTEIEFRHKDPLVVEQEACKIAQQLEKLSQKMQKPPAILGPVKPVLWKLSGLYVWQIFIKSASFSEVHFMLMHVNLSALSSTIHIHPNS